MLLITYHQPKAAAAKPQHKFVLDYSKPAEDKVFDGQAFEQYLVERIKVEGKTGQLGDNVKVQRSGDKLIVTSQIPFSKRYLKYLTKKYLRKQQLKEWLRVVATAKDTYALKFYSVDFPGAEEDEASDEE